MSYSTTTSIDALGDYMAGMDQAFPRSQKIGSIASTVSRYVPALAVTHFSLYKFHVWHRLRKSVGAEQFARADLLNHSPIHGYGQHVEVATPVAVFVRSSSLSSVIPTSCRLYNTACCRKSNENVSTISIYSFNPSLLSTPSPPKLQSNKVLCVFRRGWNCRDRDGEGCVLQRGYGRRVAHRGHPNALLRVSGGKASGTNVQRRQGIPTEPLGVVTRSFAGSLVSLCFQSYDSE